MMGDFGAFADNYWAELAKVLGVEPGNRAAQAEALRANPVLADKFFVHRFELWLKFWLKGHLGAEWYYARAEWQGRGTICILHNKK